VVRQISGVDPSRMCIRIVHRTKGVLTMAQNSQLQLVLAGGCIQFQLIGGIRSPM